jgi:hypothetical protein
VAALGLERVSKLKSSDEESLLRPLVAMLPRTESRPAAVLASLIELRAYFHGWLHQDEFGPSRAEQTAALRRLLKSVGGLCKRLEKGTAQARANLDKILRVESDPSSQIVEALMVAAAEAESASRHVGASNREKLWFARLNSHADAFSKQWHFLDDATNSQIFDTALLRKFELSLTAKYASLVKVERWLDGYRKVLDKTIQRLKARRGAQERVSLKLLVEQLCELWERETGLPATAHGIAKDVYTSRAETEAGRFVMTAVEAMLPDKSWFNAHAKFARSVRAETFLPDAPPSDRRRNARARQILVIMRSFVARRSRPKERRKRSI